MISFFPYFVLENHLDSSFFYKVGEEAPVELALGDSQSITTIGVGSTFDSIGIILPGMLWSFVVCWLVGWLVCSFVRRFVG